MSSAGVAAMQCVCINGKGIPKQSFATQQIAESFFTTRQQMYDWEPQRAYKCPDSSVWHLTSDTEAKTPTPVQVDYKQQALKVPKSKFEIVRDFMDDNPSATVSQVLSGLPKLKPSTTKVYYNNVKKGLGTDGGKKNKNLEIVAGNIGRTPTAPSKRAARSRSAGRTRKASSQGSALRERR